MKYSNYTANDFAMDEYFQKWVISSDEQIDLFWRKWMEHNPDKISVIEEARQLIQLIQFKELVPPSDASERIWNNIKLTNFENDSKKRVSTVISGNFTGSFWNSWYKVAAVFGGMFLVSYLLITTFTSAGKKEYQTAFSEKREITLPDNSIVILNSNSTLSFNSEWSEERSREVWVECEAYFNVVKQKGAKQHSAYSKFVVHSNNIDIEVLGTRFNVNNRRNETKVVLSSGKIKVKAVKENKTLMMQPGDFVEYSGQVKDYVKKKVNPEIYSSWTENIFIFDNTPLSTIAGMIEDNYGYQVDFENKEIASRSITGKIPSNDMNTVLEAMSEAFHLKVYREGNKVKFESLKQKEKIQ